MQVAEHHKNASHRKDAACAAEPGGATGDDAAASAADAGTEAVTAAGTGAHGSPGWPCAAPVPGQGAAGGNPRRWGGVPATATDTGSLAKNDCGKAVAANLAPLPSLGALSRVASAWRLEDQTTAAPPGDRFKPRCDGSLGVCAGGGDGLRCAWGERAPKLNAATGGNVGAGRSGGRLAPIARPGGKSWAAKHNNDMSGNTFPQPQRQPRHDALVL